MIKAKTFPQTYTTMSNPYSKDDPSKFALGLITPNSYVLSAGCGAGREIQYLRKEKQCRVIGLDIDPKCLKMSMEKNKGVPHILGDMVYSKFEKKFDYIVCLWNTINYIDYKSKLKFIDNCYSNLKEGGILIITTSHIFLHWRLLLSNIKYRRMYHPTPFEINKWFKNKKFRLMKIKKFNNIIIVATKQ